MNEDWQEMLTQVRAETTNDMEAFFNLASLLAECIAFPLAGDWLGHAVTITGIDQVYSSHSHGLKVTAVSIDEPLPIEEITLSNLDATSAQWLHFYQLWRDDYFT